MPESSGGSSLAAALAECIELCEATLSTMAPDATERSTMMLAVAALQTAAEAEPGRSDYELRLVIAATIARDSAASLRDSDGIEGAAECADEFERVADRCESAARSVVRNGH